MVLRIESSQPPTVASTTVPTGSAAWRTTSAKKTNEKLGVRSSP